MAAFSLLTNNVRELTVLESSSTHLDFSQSSDGHFRRQNDRFSVRPSNLAQINRLSQKGSETRPTSRCCCVTDRSDVGEREGASTQVGGAQLTCGSQRLQPVQLLSDLEDAEQLDVLHVWNQQALAGVHRQADVVRRLPPRTAPWTPELASNRPLGLQKSRLQSYPVGDVLAVFIHWGVQDREMQEPEGGGLSPREHAISTQTPLLTTCACFLTSPWWRRACSSVWRHGSLQWASARFWEPPGGSGPPRHSSQSEGS